MVDKQLEMIEKMCADKSVWKDYENGNYHVWLNIENGTKIRYTPEDEFSAAFPESMDIKITNKCSMGCVQCHEDSRRDGVHGDIYQAFIDTLHPYQEIAVGGGNVLEHPQLENFLHRLKEKKCIPSITVNQVHFMENLNRIKALYAARLVYGIGVSLADPHQEGFVEALNELPTSVVHTIVGLLSPGDVAALANRQLKILLLGYKNIRRGAAYKSNPEVAEMIRKNTQWLGEHLFDMMSSFKVLSFDNLALEQLPVRDAIGEEKWQQFYMGDDGHHTFYIDMVEQQFARSSTSMRRYDIADKSIDEMFDIILHEEEQ